MPNAYDTLITTHEDGTASLTLYKANTTDPVIEARLKDVRWQTRNSCGQRRFDDLDAARTFIHRHIPPAQQGAPYEQHGAARWTY